MFRYERPQAGRLRQFHQAGAEVLGSSEPYIDAEVIALLITMLRKLGLTKLSVKVNSVGCEQCRPKYHTYLKDFFLRNEKNFCPLCQERMKINPLRVLDCKVKTCKECLTDIEGTYQHLCSVCEEHFDDVKENLSQLSVDFSLDKFLVRGLDYYTKTAFEITSSALGSQDAIAGGGRYDKLVEQLGGPETDAVGFAIGMERLISLVPDLKEKTRTGVYAIALGGKEKKIALRLLQSLRQENIRGEINYRDSLKSCLKKASKGMYRFALIFGEEELQNDEVTIKDLDSGEQKKLPCHIQKIIEECS